MRGLADFMFNMTWLVATAVGLNMGLLSVFL